MMRVRCDGGALSAAALRTLGEHLHRVRPRHRRHLRPGERAVPLDPDRGRARDLASGWTQSGCRPPRPAATAPAWCWAPRWPVSRWTRCSTRPRRSTRSSAATSASPSSPTCRASSRPPSRVCRTSSHEINDIAFIGVNHPEHGPGLDLWVGGGLSTNPMLAQRVGAWVPLDEVPDVWEARHLDVPRLRLPAAAGQGAAEVPDQGLGHRKIPAKCSKPSTSSASCIDGPAPEPVDAPDRPRRRAAAEERPQRRRGCPDRRAGVGHHPDRGGRPGRARPVRTGSASRRTRSWSSSTSPTTSSTSWSPAWTRWGCRRARRTGVEI